MLQSNPVERSKRRIGEDTDTLAKRAMGVAQLKTTLQSSIRHARAPHLEPRHNSNIEPAAVAAS
jgi:hypothetical protein